MTEEEQLRWALEASLQGIPSAELGLAVDGKSRSSLVERQDKHKLPSVVEGTITQYNTVDQFGPQFEQAKRTHSTAAAICGYVSCANAVLLERFVTKSVQNGVPLTYASIHDFATHTLSDIDQILPETLKCMASIQERRHAYWKEKHSLEKASQSSLQEWVANYEISDYFKMQSMGGDMAAPSVFVRYNQWPELDDATPDESERLQEERRFGGIRVKQNGRMCITYGEHDSVYFMEEFVNGDSTFYTPDEFHVLQREHHDRQGVPRVLIIDLNGHFVSALSCIIEEKPHLVVFNTTGTDYISNSVAVSWTFDTMFSRQNDSTAQQLKRKSESGTTLSSSTPHHVVLLGDSTLDNVVWVTDPQTSVTCYLQRYLQSKVHGQSRVSNYAADGFTSGDVLHGGKAAISYRSRINAGDPFPDCIESDFTFHPLSALKILAQQSCPPTHIVLSVGGNDIRHILAALHTLPQVIQTLQSNYIAIVRQLRSEYPEAKIVLMFQYRPSWTQEDQYSYGVYSHINHIPAAGNVSSVEKLHSLMEVLYAPILTLAAELKLPVLDLPNSFDIHNDALYSHQIEPSATGGRVIAHMLGEVLQQHDFSAASRFYMMDTSGVSASDWEDSCDFTGNVLSSPLDDSDGSSEPQMKKWTITARA